VPAGIGSKLHVEVLSVIGHQRFCAAVRQRRQDRHAPGVEPGVPVAREHSRFFDESIRELDGLEDRASARLALWLADRADVGRALLALRVVELTVVEAAPVHLADAHRPGRPEEHGRLLERTPLELGDGGLEQGRMTGEQEHRLVSRTVP
jgi:hypothetical protein